MKRLLVLIGCTVFLLALAGCPNANSGGNTIVTGDGRFPAFLVGVWQVDEGMYKGRWGLKFEPDGSISKVVHPAAGAIDMAQGGMYLEGPDPNTYAMFVMGPCRAKYDAAARELKVEVILEYYKMKLPSGELEGRSDDYLEGPVSADGKTWQVNWRSYGWLEGAEPPDPNLIDAHPEPLVFTKLSSEELADPQ
ncbi:MAG: hypothetical protein ACYST6_01860 [Planctomycetota bacterium]|jgi:hypothetical protein